MTFASTASFTIRLSPAVSRAPGNDGWHSRFTLPELALQAAIDGAGVVLGRIVLAEADLAAGRLVRPFKTVLPLDVSYFLVRSKVAAPRQELRCFRDWLFGSLQNSSHTRRAPQIP
jgi:DNA-binding transcriptional LysR family regulator